MEGVQAVIKAIQILILFVKGSALAQVCIAGPSNGIERAKIA